MSNDVFNRDLGDGLILRRGRAEDVEGMQDLIRHGFADARTGQLDEPGAVLVGDLFSGRHPVVTPEDHFLVERVADGKLVSTVMLISQTWTYDGIPIPVGRPESVVTLPEYRGRGLIRTQFEAIHALSASRGELMQAITGITNFYRQFGYEMTVDLNGQRVGRIEGIAPLKEGEEEPFRLRDMTREDLPLLEEVYAQSCSRSLLSCVRDRAAWEWDAFGWSPGGNHYMRFAVIETPAGEAVGVIGHGRMIWYGRQNVHLLELKQGVSYAAVMPTVLRQLKEFGLQAPAAAGKDPLSRITLTLGREHPAYLAVRQQLPQVQPPYAWYIRVPDLSAFIQRVKPVLERRLERSFAPGHTGELKLSFYRSGLRLAFEKGKLTAAEPWQPKPGLDADAAFPGLTFLHLLFGHRTVGELNNVYPDCWSDDGVAEGLLSALFPKRYSDVYPLN